VTGIGAGPLLHVGPVQPHMHANETVAAIKALYQLFFRASYWELTAHGLKGSQPTAASTS
jgi:hypothetical protein